MSPVFFKLQRLFVLLLVAFLSFGNALGLAAAVQSKPVTPKSVNASSSPSVQSSPLLSQNLPPLQGRVVTAPAGSYVMTTLTSPISSEFARVGDRFYATLGNDLAAGGSIILPAGSQMEAQVVSVKSAGRTGRNGELDIRFTAATLPNGQRIPISGRVQTEDGTGVIRGGTTAGRIGKVALRTGVGAGLGAALGTALGPLSGGKVGRGAVFGTALGGGLGAVSAGLKRGEEAVLPAGQPLNVILDQPVTITPQLQQGGYSNQPAYGQQQPYGQSTPSYGNQQPYYGQPASQPQQSYPYGYNDY